MQHWHRNLNAQEALTFNGVYRQTAPTRESASSLIFVICKVWFCVSAPLYHYIVNEELNIECMCE